MKAFSLQPAPSAVEPSLPAVLLSRYLFFLSQRPVSRSNTHFVRRRIESLQSLAPLLAGGADDQLAFALRVLGTLDPSNLHEVSERLQQLLFLYTQADVPPAYISADAAPPADLLRSSERIVLVLGPAIGIGDEIVTFPLPERIRRANPDAELTVMTAYDGLWSGVPAVDRVDVYRDLRTVAEALRGDADLVVLIDFENPDLFRIVATDPEIDRYAELSLGARILSVVDNRERWTYHQQLPFAYHRNVYDAFDELTGRLGVVEDPADRVAAPPARRRDEALRVFVAPFSSKYDPQPRYWSTLLGRLVPDGAERAVEFVLDPGPNTSTTRFAHDVVRAASARAPGAAASFAVAEPAPLSLGATLAELSRADVVLCADSFAAHAAARAGRTTLVLASPGLETWRVPGDRGYYFAADAPIDAVIAGMRQALDLHGVRAAISARPPVGEPERALRDADAALGDALDGDVLPAYARFCRARADVLERVAVWPPEWSALVGEDGAAACARDVGGAPAELEPFTRSHVRHDWLRWRHTNLRKYLEGRLREERT